MMKRLFALLLVLVMVSSLFVGCTTNAGGTDATVETGEATETTETTETAEDVTLTFMVNFQSDSAVTLALEEAIADFESQTPGVQVELIAGISDYEALMKTKMGANDLPDLWSTHGWSVARYSEFLRPLTDQEWANNLHPGIEKVITNSEGEIFVLPLDVDISGIAYNKTVVEQAGVNVDDIKTWDDFMVACQAVRDAGFTPIHMGGKDSWTVGNFFDWAAPSFLITNENNNYRSELKDGSFDWSNWEPVAQLLVDLNENGYFNVDNLSSTYMDSAKNLASDKVAFTFYGNYVISEALNFNPDADLGFMPVPAASADDDPTLISGEHVAVGVWKDTEHEAEALAFINYLAQPEVMSEIASASSLPAGLNGVQSDVGILESSYDAYGGLRGFPYFDREYLPGGMWDTMCSTGSGLITGDMSTEDAASQMEKDYNRLK